mgnify:CR=1 FL=1
MRLPISGPVAAVDALLLRPRLGIPRESLFDPKRLAGDAAIELSLAFPLIETLTVNDIDVKAQAIKYVRRIEELVGCSVALLSTSPEREDTILMRDPFED